MDMIKQIELLENELEKKNIDDKVVNQIEKNLNLKFSDDYREYLITYGIAAINGHELTGITDYSSYDVKAVTIKMKKINEGIPKEWYVIEDLGIDGVVIWQNEKGEVFRSIPKGEKIKIYDDLISYLSE